MDKKKKVAMAVLDRMVRIAFMLDDNDCKLKLKGGVSPQFGKFTGGFLEKKQGKCSIVGTDKKGMPCLPFELVHEIVASALIGTPAIDSKRYGTIELHLDPAEYDRVTPGAMEELVERLRETLDG